MSGWYGWAEIGFSVIDCHIPTITVSLLIAVNS